MAALAEGLNILHGADAGLRPRDKDAETAPLDHPEFYSYSLDVPAISEVWRRGSVVESWLLDLTAAALQESPDARRLRRARLRLGRGALDGDRGDRGGRAGRRAHRRALLALLLPRRGPVREQGAVGDAQAVRRPPREARHVASASVRAGGARGHREPGAQRRENSPSSAEASASRAASRSAGSTSTSRAPPAFGTPSQPPAPMFVTRWLQRMPSARRNVQTTSAATSFGAIVTLTGSLHHAPTAVRGRPQSVDAELEVVDRDSLIGRVDEPRGELDVHRLLREEAVGDRAEGLPHPVGVGEAGTDERHEAGARARSRRPSSRAPTRAVSPSASGCRRRARTTRARSRRGRSRRGRADRRPRASCPAAAGSRP